MDQQSTPTTPTPHLLSGEEGPGGQNPAQEVALSQLHPTDSNPAGHLAQIEEVELALVVPHHLSTTDPDGRHPLMWYYDEDGNSIPVYLDEADDSDIFTFNFLAETHQSYRESLGPAKDDFPSLYPIGPSLATLPPHNQGLIRDYYSRLSNAYAELWDEDPSRVPMTEEALSELFGPQGSFDALQNIEESHRERIESFFLSFERVFKRKNSSFGPQLPTLPQLMDLLSKPAGEATIDSNQTHSKSAPSCSLCLEEYLPDHTVVTLQCDPSHHFHRNCAEVSTYTTLISLSLEQRYSFQLSFLNFPPSSQSRVGWYHSQTVLFAEFPLRSSRKLTSHALMITKHNKMNYSMM
jgi:hypothetical protein